MSNIKLKQIKVGEQFVYRGFTYTKLTEDGLCILDDFESDLYQECIFDNVNNDYESSLIRHYIISAKFVNFLNIKLDDIKINLVDDSHVDRLFLLSKEEFEKFKYIIKPFARPWWLRSAGRSATCACFVFYDSYTGDIFSVRDTFYGVRPALNFNLNTLISRKPASE